MTEPLQFGFLGLAAGSMLALAAIGLVVIYRATGVINFAHGATGMAATYVYWELYDKRSMSFGVALTVGVTFAVLIGLACHLLIMQPLRDASPLTRLIGTLGVCITLQAIAVIRYPQGAQLVSTALPQERVEILGTSIGQDRVVLFCISASLTALLWIVYRFTRFGLRTAAVAEDHRVFASIGHSPAVVGAANWAIGSGLAGLTGILLAPLVGLNSTQLTLLVIPALAAAVVGRLVSFPITFVAGLAIGVIQSEMARYVTTPGWPSAVPFILMVAFLAARGTTLPSRTVLRAWLPQVGSGRVNPTAVVVFMCIAIAVIQGGPPRWVNALTTSGITAIILLSIVVIVGYAGQLSLAQYALAGMGAWVAAHLVADYSLSFELALVIGVVAVVPIGVVVGAPSLRARGPSLAVATLGLSVAMDALIFNNSSLSGSNAGIAVDAPTMLGWNIDALTHPKRYALVVVGACLIAGLTVANLRRGPGGRRLIAVRTNERAAAAAGISVTSAKLFAFGFAAAIAALGGILLAFRSPNILFTTDFDPFRSIVATSQAVIGGIGFVLGAGIGSVFQSGGIGSEAGRVLGDSVDRYIVLAGGVIMLGNLVVMPDGLAAVHAALGDRFRRWRAVDGDHRVATVDAPPVLTAARRTVVSVPARTLRVDSLTVSYGGVVALSNVTLEVGPGDILGVIGPNGAGKTTLIDAITGFTRLHAGRIDLEGTDISQLSPHKRAHAGVGRSFQSLELYEDLTVLENLLVGAEAGNRFAYLSSLARPGRPQLTDATIAAIEEFELADHLQTRPRDLSYGLRRLVAVARAIAAEPSVLLLDEPAAGIDEHASAELGRLVQRLASNWGMAIVLVEHDLELVLAASNRVVAIDSGRVIAEGAPMQVRHDSAVRRAYMGEDVGDDLHQARPSDASALLQQHGQH